MTPIIEVKGLSKKYQIGEQQSYLTLRDSLANLMKSPLKKISNGLQKDEFWALNNVNFSIERGEVVGIIGSNGAGKSTLLKVLSRITPPTTGEVTLYGNVGSLLEVGTGFQQELTGRENIFLNGAILGMSQREIKSKFNEIVDFAEVGKFIDTPVKHYSSGMYTRLAFAVASHLEPDILLVDEVLAVGDTSFQRRSMKKMSEVSEHGRTILYVSHNMASIRSLCKRVIYLKNGKIIEIGDAEEVIGKYLAESRDKNEHSGSITISLNDHLNKGESVIIKKVSILKENAETSPIIGYEKNFAVRVDAFCKKRITSVRLGLSIEKEDGTRIATIYNTDCGERPKIIKPGKISWIINIQNPLNPGKYRLGINLMKALVDPLISGPSIENVPECIYFDVSDLHDQSKLHSTYAVGIVSMTANWEYKQQ